MLQIITVFILHKILPEMYLYVVLEISNSSKMRGVADRAVRITHFFDIIIRIFHLDKYGFLCDIRIKL